MLKKTLVAAILLSLPLGAVAQSSSQLVERYTKFAGSKENATSLVNGLRDGSEVKLTSREGSETFKPATGKMGYGNVDHALALAEASLKQKGITNPTPAQLSAAIQGVTRMRADGMGWGQIANSMGFKLGEIKRADRADRVVKAERPEKPQRPEKPARPEKPERHK
jgi:hypothetical protein